jgi:hypothetical protein
MSRPGIHDHIARLVYYDKVFILEDDIERNILTDDVLGFG